MPERKAATSAILRPDNDNRSITAGSIRATFAPVAGYQPGDYSVVVVVGDVAKTSSTKVRIRK